MGIRYFVHDKTRRCRMTTGKGEAQETLDNGFREVTREEMEAFRVETHQQLKLMQARKGRLV